MIKYLNVRQNQIPENLCKFHCSYNDVNKSPHESEKSEKSEESQMQ